MDLRKTHLKFLLKKLCCVVDTRSMRCTGRRMDCFGETGYWCWGEKEMFLNKWSRLWLCCWRGFWRFWRGVLVREASALQPERDFSSGRRPRPRRSYFERTIFDFWTWLGAEGQSHREKRKERKRKLTLRLFVTFNWERIGFFFPQSQYLYNLIYPSLRVGKSK